jgi:hypothetical protein
MASGLFAPTSKLESLLASSTLSRASDEEGKGVGDGTARRLPVFRPFRGAMGLVKGSERRTFTLYLHLGSSINVACFERDMHGKDMTFARDKKRPLGRRLQQHNNATNYIT